MPKQGDRIEPKAAALLEDGALNPAPEKVSDPKFKAGEFFDSLAQFYRNGYLRWIDATKRSPDQRAARIAEMVELLKAGRKERPPS